MHTPIAVILARGLGTRMRREDAAAALGEDQARVAATGVKAMIPIGRPFLDYLLSGLADAGLVRGRASSSAPSTAPCATTTAATSAPTRVRIEFAVQAEPLGTADAVAAAADVVGSQEFLVAELRQLLPGRGLPRTRGPGRTGPGGLRARRDDP